MNPVRWLADVLLLRRPERPEPPDLTEITVKSEQTSARVERVLTARQERLRRDGSRADGRLHRG